MNYDNSIPAPVVFNSITFMITDVFLRTGMTMQRFRKFSFFTRGKRYSWIYPGLHSILKQCYTITMEQESRENFPDLAYEQFEKLYNSGKDITFGFIRFLLDRLKIQEDDIKLLQAKIKDLELQLVKASHNSSKPPSSDGFKDKKKKPKSLRKKGKKKPGGLFGDRQDVHHQS